MSKHPDIIDVIIRDNQLVFSDQLIEWLSAKQGDKISIGYIEKDDKLTPVVEINETGHKLNKNNTISFRGKQREVLGQLGTNFWATVGDDKIITLEGDGMPVFTTVKKAVETYLTKDIIEDTNYSITKLTNYEF
jgi:hypothetical protein